MAAIQLTFLAILLGFISILVHAVGATWWAERMLGRYANHDGYWKSTDVLLIWVSTAMLLLLLHFVEILIWASTYLLLPGITELNSLESALYFSFVTFTTLGFGDITLGPEWRILSGAEAMTGILLFGWSTAMLFFVVQRTWASAHTSRNQ